MGRGISLILLLLTITLINSQDWSFNHFDKPLGNPPNITVETQEYEVNNSTADIEFEDGQVAAVNTTRDNLNETLTKALTKLALLDELQTKLESDLGALEGILNNLREKLPGSLAITTDVYLALSFFLNNLRASLSYRFTDRYHKLIVLYAPLQSKYVDCKELELTFLESVVALIQSRITLIQECKAFLPAAEAQCTIDNLLTTDLGVILSGTNLATVQAAVDNLIDLNATVHNNRNETKECYVELKAHASNITNNITNYLEKSEDEIEDGIFLKYLINQVEKVEKLSVFTYDDLIVFLTESTKVTDLVAKHEGIIKRLYDGTVSVTATVNLEADVSNHVNITVVHTATHGGQEGWLEHLHLAVFKSVAGVNYATIHLLSLEGDEAILVITIKRFENDWVRNAHDWVRVQVVEHDITTVVNDKVTELKAESENSTSDVNSLLTAADAELTSLKNNVTNSTVAEEFANRAEAAANQTVDNTVTTEEGVFDAAVAAQENKKQQLLEDLASLHNIMGEQVQEAKVNFLTHLVLYYTAIVQYRDTEEQKYNQSAHDLLVFVGSSLAVHEKKKQALEKVQLAIAYINENDDAYLIKLNQTRHNLENGVYKNATDIKEEYNEARDQFTLRIVALLRSFLQVSSPDVEYMYLNDTLTLFQIKITLKVFLEPGDVAGNVRERVRVLLTAIVKLVTGVNEVTVTLPAKRDVDQSQYTVQVGDGTPPVVEPEAPTEPQPESTPTPSTPTPPTPSTPTPNTPTPGTPTPKTPTPSPKTPTPTNSPTPTAPVTPSSGAMNYVSLVMLVVGLLALLF